MPTRRMLINAVTPEEVRIAIVTDSVLDGYQVEVEDRGLTRGNIYRGIISNIEPSLNAAFIDYGGERSGFLAIQDVVPEAYYKKPKERRPRIDEVLERGRPVVVQVTREAEGTKGAVLTTNLSLPGRYLVLTPFDDHRGLSRKVEDEETRKAVKKRAAGLQVPQGSGFIIRTNAADEPKTALSRDLAALLRLWKQIGTEARQGKGIKLLYSDQDILLRALRDYLDSSVDEVVVDDEETYQRAQEHMRALIPRGKTNLVRYAERTPLFSRYGLEAQIEHIYERTVALPSGGSIVIDRTEALTAIDVNSGKSTKASSQEETALATNLEAAREVARQLRLRDIGGLLVVDFIDMRASRNQRKVEKTLKDAMKADKARSSVGRISSNGLLEINRQRIQQALSLRTHRPCPTCSGTGRIASPEMVGLKLLRRIEARVAGGDVGRVRIALHPELADAFQNGRRQEIASLEREFGTRVEVIAASHLHRPEQEIEWVDRRPGEERRRPEPTPAREDRQAGRSAGGEGGRNGGGTDEGRSRKRRRSRRKKKSSGEGGAAAGHPGAQGESRTGAAASGEEKGSRGKGASPEKGSGGAGSGRSGPGDEGPGKGGPGGSGSQEVSGDGEAASGQGGSSKGRKRRPRRRRKKTGGGGEG